MRHPNVPAELAEAVEDVAKGSGLSVGYDTHFDAGNVELTWWVGRTLNRLDFQPLPKAGIQVTFHTDTYPLLPRLLRFLRSCIPMFPRIAKTKYRVLGSLERNQERANYAEQIRRFVADAA
jgi:hypothetical protein